MAISVKAGMVGGLGTRDFAKFVLDSTSIEVRAGVEAGAEGLRDELRDQVANAGMGERLGKAVGAQIYPRGGKGSLDAAGFVYPRGRKAAAIFDAYNQGVTITAHNAKWLAIPTKFAGKGFRGARARPKEFQERTGIKLRFVKAKNGNAVLIGDKKQRAGSRARRKPKSIVYFVLIRIVKIPHRLSFDASAQKWADRIPSLIEAAKRGDD